MDLMETIHTYVTQISLMLTLLTLFIAFRVMWDIKKTPSSKNKKILYVMTAGLISTSFLFQHLVVAGWGVVLVIGWLLGATCASTTSKHWIKKISAISALFLICISCVGLISGYAPSVSMGPSMWPTSPKGWSFNIVHFNAYRNAPLRYGDVIDFDVSSNKNAKYGWSEGRYHKRVWALPGDKIDIRGMSVWLNNKLIADCSSRKKPIANHIWFCRVTWPNGVSQNVVWGDMNPYWVGHKIFILNSKEAFVMGDNTVESDDSRTSGPIQKKWIDGRYDSKPKKMTVWHGWEGEDNTLLLDENKKAIASVIK